ncbi:MAG: RecX family transcriptional regulator [Rhodospirillales bacterium]
MESPPRSDDDMPEAPRKKGGPRKRRAPKKVTQSHLANAALHYLSRFATTAENLRRVLMRRVEKSARHHGTDPAEGAEWIEDLIQRYQRTGLLNDAAYAEVRAGDMLRRGTPVKGVRFKLMQKGVGPDDIDQALAAATEDMPQPDLAAAAALARRRRLGPYASPDKRQDRRDKDLATLARAGFDYDTARRVIEAETVDDLEHMLDDG